MASTRGPCAGGSLAAGQPAHGRAAGSPGGGAALRQAARCMRLWRRQLGARARCRSHLLMQQLELTRAPLRSPLQRLEYQSGPSAAAGTRGPPPAPWCAPPAWGCTPTGCPIRRQAVTRLGACAGAAPDARGGCARRAAYAGPDLCPHPGAAGHDQRMLCQAHGQPAAAGLEGSHRPRGPADRQPGALLAGGSPAVRSPAPASQPGVCLRSGSSAASGPPSSTMHPARALLCWQLQSP